MARRRAKPKHKLGEGESVTLPKAQQRAVLALAAQREQIKSEANCALAEIGEALRELASIYAVKAGLPSDERYDFETRDLAVVLVPWKEEKTEVNNDGD